MTAKKQDTYKVKKFKPSGKWYEDCPDIVAGEFSLYTEVPQQLRQLYPDDFNNGYIFLVTSENGDGISHLFNVKN